MKMKALISTIEPRETGYRVAQVEQEENIFALADDFFWVDCADNVIADDFWYDPSDQSIKPIPRPEILPQPTNQGAQTL